MTLLSWHYFLQFFPELLDHIGIKTFHRISIPCRRVKVRAFRKRNTAFERITISTSFTVPTDSRDCCLNTGWSDLNMIITEYGVTTMKRSIVERRKRCD